MVGGDVRRECGPLSRWFWRQWFSLDHVELHPARRGESFFLIRAGMRATVGLTDCLLPLLSDYLEYKFGTIKCYNGRNHFVIPFIVRIPFYVWIGCSRSRNTTTAVQAFEVEAGNRVIVSSCCGRSSCRSHLTIDRGDFSALPLSQSCPLPTSSRRRRKRPRFLASAVAH